MSSSVEQWAKQYEEVVRDLGTGQDFHARSRTRYIRTALLAEEHVALMAFSSIAEVGAGPLLPMMCRRWNCAGTAYGLLNDSWRQDLAKLDLVTVSWDANTPLPDVQEGGRHDLLFFCEVIEHLNRWPVEVLHDLGSLLRPGGKLILTTVNFVRLSNRLRMLAGKSPLINPFEKTLDGSNHIREYTLPELERYLVKAGFSDPVSYSWSIYPPGLRGALANFTGWLMPSMRNYVALVVTKPSSGAGGSFA